jgi:hypothetical protein
MHWRVSFPPTITCMLVICLSCIQATGVVVSCPPLDTTTLSSHRKETYVGLAILPHRPIHTTSNLGILQKLLQTPSKENQVYMYNLQNQ